VAPAGVISRPSISVPSNDVHATRRHSGRGFPAVVATGCDQEYDRYLVPGDRLSATIVMEHMSEEKTTALGVGYFLTLRTDYRDQDGKPVGRMRFITLQYAPAQKAAATPERVNRPSPPQPGISQDTQFFWDGLKADKLLIQRCASCGLARHADTSLGRRTHGTCSPS